MSTSEHGLRVLVTDDDALQRAMVRRVLTAQGWDVDEATTAQEAIDLARKTRYDAIVLDFVLPDADGLETMDAFAHWGVDAPVVALSGSESPEVATALLRAGVVEYVRKDALSALRIAQSVRHARRVHQARAMLISQRAGGPGARREPDEPEPTIVTTVADSIDVKGARVLLIDDTEVSRLVIRRLLEPHGWLVEEADTGRDALDRVRRREPDVVLLDYLLPDTAGPALLPKLRAAGMKAPVVALTAHGSERVAEEFLAAGAVDYLAKEDLPESRLLLTLRNALWLRRAG